MAAGKNKNRGCSRCLPSVNSPAALSRYSAITLDIRRNALASVQSGAWAKGMRFLAASGSELDTFGLSMAGQVGFVNFQATTLGTL